jgi:hypothetical protein
VREVANLSQPTPRVNSPLVNRDGRRRLSSANGFNPGPAKISKPWWVPDSNAGAVERRSALKLEKTREICLAQELL